MLQCIQKFRDNRLLVSVNNSFSKSKYSLSSAIHIFLIFYCILLFFVSFSINAGDAGELIAAAWHLGVPHPPGYPLYTLLAKAASFLPFGNIAFRVNLLSLFFAALVCAMFLPITNVIASLSPRLRKVNPSIFFMSSFLSALFLAVSPSFLNYIIISEVYSLNAFLFVFIILTGLKCYTGICSIRLMFSTAFLSGLAIGNHHTIVFMLPLALLFVPVLKKAASSGSIWRNFSIMISFFLLGLSVYIYLPLRSAQNPLLDWGGPQSIGSFLDVFSRRGYGGDPLRRSMGTLVEQFKSFDLLGEFGLVGLFLSTCGFWSLWRCSRIVSVSFASMFFFFSFLIILLSGDFRGDPEILKPFFIPALVMTAIFISLGILFVMQKVETFIPRKILSLIVLFCVLLGLYSRTADFRRGNNLSDDFFAFDYAMNTLKSIDQGSSYLAYIDSKVFALWYLQMVESYRADVEIVPVDFLSHHWYSAQGYRRTDRPQGLDLMVNNKIYAASLDEAGLIHDIKYFSKGITFRLGDNKEEKDADVWEYYTLRGLNSSVSMKSYEYKNILSDYASAYFNLGIDRYMEQKPEDASAAYKKSLEIRPHSPDVLNNLSLLYVDMGINLSEAEEMAKEAIGRYTVRKNKINATDTLGWVYYRMGRYKDALEMLDLCMDDLSGEPSYNYHLGMTMFALKRLSDAETFLAMATPGLDGEARKEALLALGSIRTTLSKGESL